MKVKDNCTNVRRRVLWTPPSFMVYRPRRSWGLGFARENALTSSPDDSAWEDVVFVSRQDAKLAKEIQRRKAADPEALRPASGLTNRSFRRDAKLERKVKGNCTNVRRRALWTPSRFMVYRTRRSWGLGFARNFHLVGLWLGARLLDRRLFAWLAIPRA